MSWIDIEVPTFTDDMDSQVKLACYPQRTFCPICDHPSSRYDQITKTDFSFRWNPCLNCRSYSQASICLCALLWISFQMNSPLVHLRYPLEDCRPSQTNIAAFSLLSWLVEFIRLVVFHFCFSTPTFLHIFLPSHFTAFQLRCMGSFRLPPP